MDEPSIVVTTGDEELPTVVRAERVPAETDAPVPFRRLDDDGPAGIVLHQISPTEFRLVEGFRYEGRAGRWEVHPEDLPNTDLASIPRLLGWFAGSYGNHTLAALLHDHLVRNGDGLDPPVPRHLADDVFRDALDDLSVPYLRSRIMWSAVVLATRWKHPVQRVAMAVWVAAALAGVMTLVWAVATGRPVPALVAAVAPIPAAALWGRREVVAGLVGGYTLWFVALPTVLNFLAYSVYAGVEAAVCGLRVLCRRPGRPPGPPPFQGR